MIRWLLDLFSRDPGDPFQLDHVPVGSFDYRTPERIAEAREKLGKPFAPETKVTRVTEPSYVLDNINAQTELAKRTKATVTQIGKRK